MGTKEQDGAGQTQSKKRIPGSYSRGQKAITKPKLQPILVSPNNKKIPSTLRTNTY